MPLRSFLSASSRSCCCTGRRSSSKFSSCTSLRTRSQKEEDGACGYIENGRGDVPWRPEFDHPGHQEGNGHRKVEVSGLHTLKLAMLRREGNHGGGRNAIGQAAG